MKFNTEVMPLMMTSTHNV